MTLNEDKIQEAAVKFYASFMKNAGNLGENQMSIISFYLGRGFIEGARYTESEMQGKLEIMKEALTAIMMGNSPKQSWEIAKEALKAIGEK